MNEPPREPPPALSFADVADAYDRGRPAYPAEAAAWLAGGTPRRVLELGAGTGRLTTELVTLGHEVVATDPLGPMLRHLARRLPDVPALQATAEQIPLPARSVDVVTSAQAFHWFDLDRALPEIARVLRPGGELALVWNERDERIPWVRRLGEVLGSQEQETDPTQELIRSHLFGFVETHTFRFWQRLDRDLLKDLVLSRSNVATRKPAEQQRVLARAEALYDEYGRGADGMLLPYVTRCFKTVVRAKAEPEPVEPPVPPPTDPRVRDDDGGGDGSALLIDFH